VGPEAGNFRRYEDHLELLNGKEVVYDHGKRITNIPVSKPVP
jgi:hypothetical protein